MTTSTEQLARELYSTYCGHVHWKAYRGDDLPGPEAFFTDPTKELQSKAWIEVAKRAEQLLKQPAPNPQK